jgi:monovalent cation/hydrogen antiporter
MGIFELTIGLLLVAAYLARLARWLKAPYPALLALAGTVAAFIPGVPETALDPALALALFVAPTLLDAAYDASPRDLHNQWTSVVGLAIVAVALTVGAVALAARAMMPALPWAVAIALGAIVAPPDASAAEAVLRQVRLPHRLMVILEGESLFNDAVALLIYRFAVIAAMTGAVALAGLPLVLAFTCGGGVLLGMALAWLFLRAAASLSDDMPIWIMVQFLAVFGVWLLADALGLSPIITVVAFAMTLSRLAPLRMDAQHRISSYAVWEVAVFVLNALAFLLIGLQLRVILGRLDGAMWGSVAFALGILAVVILVRLAWVMAWVAALRIRHDHFHALPGGRPSWRGGLLVSWCGMRGIVTVAAALALPAAFPYRDFVVLSAVVVSVGTLVLQGLSLRWLIERLGLEDDDSMALEVRRARIAVSEAALRALDHHPDGAALGTLRDEFSGRLAAAQMNEIVAGGIDAVAALRGAVAAQRQALDRLRRSGEIGDAAFQAVVEEVDVVELSADPRLRPSLLPASGGAA